MEQKSDELAKTKTGKKRKARRSNFKIFLIFSLICIVFLLLWGMFFENIFDYKRAQKLMAEGKFYNAYEILTSLAKYDYKDAKERSSELETLKIKVSFDPKGGVLPDGEDNQIISFIDPYENLPTPYQKGYLFDGWYATIKGVETKVNSEIQIVSLSDHVLYATWRDPEIGQIGEAGGYVFYDKGTYSNGWRYLEAAPSNNEYSGKVWGGAFTSAGGTDTAIGTGESNTEKIVAEFGNAEPDRNRTDYAAKLCYDLKVTKDGEVYDDWFLPSKDELNQMYKNLKKNNLGVFSDDIYWSSSKFDPVFVWFQSFGEGDEHYIYPEKEYRVRPVRAF